MYNLDKQIYNVLIYLRKSREDIEFEKRTGEDTLSKHRLVLTNIAKERKYNFDIREELESGDSIAGRPVFQKILKHDFTSGKYQAIMVTELSRLGRSDMQDCGRIMNALKDNNLLIITPNKIYDIHNSSDARQIRFELFLAREEYELIKERFKRGKEIRLSQGLSPQGVSYQLGYESYKGQIRIIPEQALIIKKMFELRTQRHSYAQIAEILNDLGYKTKKGTIIHSTTVGKVLKNKLYIGYVKFRNEWHKGTHEPIISEELWNKAQLVEKENTHESPTHISSPYIISLYCALCGKRMYGDIHVLKNTTSPDRHRIYRCKNTSKIHKEYNFVYADDIHNFIKFEIDKIVSSKKFLDKYIEFKNKQLNSKEFSAKITKLQKELQEKELFIERLEKDYESGVLPVNLYVKHYEQNNEQLLIIKNELQLLNEKISEHKYAFDNEAFLKNAKYILDNWDSTSNENKRALIKQLFDRVEFDIRGKEIILSGISS